MPIDFEKKRKQRQETDQKADELISYVRKNCTQSTEMLKFLDQPALKKEISKTLGQFQSIKDEMKKDV